MSLSEPTLDAFGALLMEQVRDRAIQEADVSISHGSKVAHRAWLNNLVESVDAQQRDALHRLIPVIVDVTLHYLLWTLEEWDTVQVSMRTETGATPDIRTLTVGELQGYLYEWIPRFSKQRYDPPA